MESVREKHGHVPPLQDWSNPGALDRNQASILGRTPDAPEDPLAYVTAPKKPRPPSRGAAARGRGKPDD